MTKTNESPSAKFFIGMGCSWLFEASCGHQLEFLKISKQTNAHLSYMSILSSIVREKGVIGLWDGFVPWGSIQAIAKGGVFAFAHAGSRKALEPHTKSSGGALPDFLAEVIAGGIGGGFQGLVLSPTLLLKTRVMTDPVFRQKMTFSETTSKSVLVGMSVVRTEGVASLMKGSITFSTKRVADWSTRYFFSIMVQRALYGTERKVEYHEQMVASLIGGTLSACATIPLDVLVAQIQQASKAGQNVSAVETFMNELKQGGLRQVVEFSTRGGFARVAHVALTTALMKTATSVVYDAYCR